jgi:hypothetical protein
MKIVRTSGWRWWPTVFRAQHVDAPYRTLIRFGCWLIFLGGRNDRYHG